MSKKDNPGLAATKTPGDLEILNAIQNTPEGQKCKCPCCGQPLPFQSLDWLDELAILINRYSSQLGLTSDISSLGLIALWGLYLHLSRLGGGS